jgi:hypothetical protein
MVFLTEKGRLGIAVVKPRYEGPKHVVDAPFSKAQVGHLVNILGKVSLMSDVSYNSHGHDRRGSPHR